MDTIKLTVRGLSECREQLKGAGRKGRYLSPVLKQCAALTLTSMSDCFREQRDPHGVPWAELAESTRRAKLNKALGGRASRYWKDTGIEKTRAERARETRFKRYKMGRMSRREGAWYSEMELFARGIRGLGYSAVSKERVFRKYEYRKSTLKKILKVSGESALLVDTGHLARVSSRLNTRTSIEFGSNVHYGVYHQTGTKNDDGSQRMPARMWAPMEVENERWVTTRIGPGGEMWNRCYKMITQYILRGDNE